MVGKDLERQIIVLFDEQGTPTFGRDRENDWFLGVAVTYDLAEEQGIFRTCDELFGLSNQRPLKNNRISNSRAERISASVTQLPLQTIVRSVNLADHEFQQALTVYEQLGNELRKKHRQVGERNIAQILHFHILVETVFMSVIGYVQRGLTSSVISLCVDDWSLPRDDMEIYLKDWARSIESDVNSFYQEQSIDLNVRTLPVSLMKEDSRRKRFVDVITSVVSRSFLRENSVRFSRVPLQTLLTNNMNRYEDVTKASIGFVRGLMDDMSRNPPVG